MTEADDRFQIGEFAELVGLSIPQLRRYDRLDLLEPAERSTASGYRYYRRSQSGAARVIALLRSMDMPIGEIRRIVSGASEVERRQIVLDHRARLEARLEEVRRLVEAVDGMTKEGPMTVDAKTDLSAWLHVLPHVPVSDMERSIAYYVEALGFDLSWRSADGQLAAMSSGGIEILLLVPWGNVGAPPPQSFYVYVEDPDALCAELERTGADVVESVASRAYGMRDFVIRDPDGHRFTLGRGEERLREVADHYGLAPEEVAVSPDWITERRRR